MYIWDTRLELSDLLGNFDTVKQDKFIKNNGIKVKRNRSLRFRMERRGNMRVLKGRIEETPAGIKVHAELDIPLETHLTCGFLIIVGLFLAYVESNPLYLLWVVFITAVYLFCLRFPKDRQKELLLLMNAITESAYTED